MDWENNRHDKNQTFEFGNPFRIRFQLVPNLPNSQQKLRRTTNSKCIFVSIEKEKKEASHSFIRDAPLVIHFSSS
jgi:hypothetical protein